VDEQPIRIFVSYAREDEEERKGLSSHLNNIPNVTIWDDRAIPSGSEWNNEIIREIEQADIILLLISTSFLNSEYVKNVEIMRALKRHEEGSSVVIPVLLKECI
jgi:hypothetical protein